MQGTNSGQGNQNGQKQSALSWSQPPQTPVGGAKPISQVAVPPVQSKISPPQPVNKNNSDMPSSKKPENKSSGGGARSFGIFAAGIIVGLIVGWGWFSLRGESPKVAVDTTNNSAAAAATNTSGSSNTGASAPSGSTAAAAEPDASVAASAGALSIGSQPSGASVLVSGVSVSVPTWVVIFDNSNGKPGNALGAAMFFPGQKSGTVELLRATLAGQTYLAGEYVDNGDHIFSKQSDAEVKDITGSQMLVQFNVQ